MMIKTYWEQLSNRERWLVSLMSVVVLVSLFYFALWEPLQSGIVEKRKRVTAQTMQLQTMRQQAAEVEQLRRSSRGSQRKVSNSSSLLVIIERTSKQKGLKASLKKVQPDGEDGVRLWLEDVAFDQMIDWLKLLKQHHGIYIDDISVEAREAPGRVDSRILLRVSP